MRHIIFLILLLSLSLPLVAEDLNQQIVADYSNAVDNNTKVRIAALAKDLKAVTGVEMSIAVVDSSTQADSQIFGRALFDRRAIEKKKQELEQGVLLLVSVQDKKVEIAAGSKLNFLLTPENKEKIKSELYPYLIKGKLSEALYLGSASIMSEILEKLPSYEKNNKAINPQNFWFILLVLIACAVIVTLIFDKALTTAISIVAGGMFAFVLLGLPSTFFGVAIGLLVGSIGYKERKDSVAQKEFRIIYERWKEEQRAKREAKNAGNC